jgi:asparagine synthase (glutamine-hydrolysing)
MCAIVGFAGPGDRQDLSAMLEAVAHRGPDGEGQFHEPDQRLFLGHRRLAIIDLADGEQPMWDADRSVCVVFNGEIYNHRELRVELEAKGHRFLTDHSDTEVLIHGYREWGTDLPSRLNGMFAFCIYDAGRRLLFLARDRFGEKPLYFARQGKLFAFASELTAIARHSEFEARLDQRSLQKFFAYGFIPAPNALLQNTSKLPGGHAMQFDLESGALRIWKYWGFKLEPDEACLHRREDDLVEELREHLFRAVERRLVADVPLGFFLSGGIDSSAIVAAAKQFMPAHDIRTFTLGFSEPSFDESGHARSVAAALGVQQDIEWLDLDRAREDIPRLLSRLDEPSCDASVLPTHLLSQFTRRHVKVSLSGDGGDELFAGYDPFSALAPAALYEACIPKPLHGLIQSLAQNLPVSTRNISLDFKIKRTLAGLDYPRSMWNPVWMSAADPKLLKNLFEDALPAEDLYSEAIDVWEAGKGQSLVDQSLDFYTNFYLQDGILNKVDRATMMASLESRAPFLDNDLVAFCQRLPHQLKFKNGCKKYLLKRAMSGLLPSEIIDRPKKGFGLPSGQWLKSYPATPPLETISGVRMQAVGDIWQAHRQGRADHRIFLWGWLSLQSVAYGAGVQP